MPIVPLENNDEVHARLAELQKRTRPHLPKPSVLEVAHFHTKFLKMQKNTATGFSCTMMNGWAMPMP